MKCPGMNLAGTWDIFSHYGTAPGNPGQLVTLYINQMSADHGLGTASLHTYMYLSVERTACAGRTGHALRYMQRLRNDVKK